MSTNSTFAHSGANRSSKILNDKVKIFGGHDIPVHTKELENE